MRLFLFSSYAFSLILALFLYIGDVQASDQGACTYLDKTRFKAEGLEMFMWELKDNGELKVGLRQRDDTWQFVEQSVSFITVRYRAPGYKASEILPEATYSVDRGRVLLFNPNPGNIEGAHFYVISIQRFSGNLLIPNKSSPFGKRDVEITPNYTMNAEFKDLLGDGGGRKWEITYSNSNVSPSINGKVSLRCQVRSNVTPITMVKLAPIAPDTKPQDTTTETKPKGKEGKEGD